MGLIPYLRAIFRSHGLHMDVTGKPYIGRVIVRNYVTLR